MVAGRRVLITGVASHWGTELARRLERDPSIEYLAGIDTRRPAADLERTDFIEADIRNPILSKILPPTEVDTVVHCGIVWYPEPGKPPRALHDINVIGTLQLLAACEATPTLKTVVVRGSAAIYGCEPASPAFFTEDMARRFPLRTRFQRDIGELENYFENFATRMPSLVCTMLRYQPEVGPHLDAPLARYLSLPVVPTQLGFNPRLQFLHARDATGALAAAVQRPVRGPVNVGPDGTVSLTRILRMAGKQTIPLPHSLFTSALAPLRGRLGLADLYGDALRLLRYGRGVDNTRLKQEVGFTPAYDAEGAVSDIVSQAAGRRVVSAPRDVVASVLERVAGA